ncbi:MAG: hypothetical protein ACYDHH_08310 [Solirubrobacteraceae bacterium]|jgi:uncharacterized protein YcsI (UPF0317 family)
MSKQNPKPPPVLEQPGPGRATSEIAFNELRREVARTNEAAHQVWRKRRAEKDREKLAARRAQDL